MVVLFFFKNLVKILTWLAHAYVFEVSERKTLVIFDAKFIT